MLDDWLVSDKAGYLEKISTLVMVLTGIVVGLNPFPHMTTIHDTCYYLALLLGVFYIVKKRGYGFIKTPLTLPVAVFTFWVFLGLFWALDSENSIHDFRSHLLEYIALFAIIVTFFNSPRKLTLLGWIVVLSVAISSAIGLFKFYISGGAPLMSRFVVPASSSPPGPVGVMAMYAVLFSLQLLRLEKSYLLKFLLLSCLFVVAATALSVQSRALVVALPCIFMLFLGHNKKLLVLGLIIAIAIGGFTMTKLRKNPTRTNYSPRLTINYIAYLVFKEHPIKGIGFGIDTFGNNKFIDHEALRKQVPQKIRNETTIISSPHNMWMSMLLRNGVVGFGLFAFILYRAGVMCWRITRDINYHLWGYFLASTFSLFLIYGLFNVVFMHFMETLMCVSFSSAAVIYQKTLEDS